MLTAKKAFLLPQNNLVWPLGHKRSLVVKKNPNSFRAPLPPVCVGPKHGNYPSATQLSHLPQPLTQFTPLNELLHSSLLYMTLR